jgi:RNase P/RNase MRP subunit POP5
MPVRSVRRRYLWIHVETEADPDQDTLDNTFNAKIHYLYGVKGALDMNYRIIEFFPEHNDAIIRCNHTQLNEMRTTLAHVSEIEGKPARIDVKLVSGTIKTLKKKMTPL